MNSYYGEEEGLNLFEAKQSIAISVIGASDGMTKYDPKYVRMIGQYFYLDQKGN